AEYILMEYLPGIRLERPQHGKKTMFLLKIIDIQLELKKLTFSKIGSIFFDGKNGFEIGQVIENNFFNGEQVTLSTVEWGPFNTTQEYILNIIRNQIHYYKSKDTQKCWIPKYEKLCKLVPKYFQDDGNDTYVLTHGDFHLSNILVKNDEITGIIDWECSSAFPIEFLCTYLIWISENPVSKNNLLLKKFFCNELSCRDSNFIRIIDNINEGKKEFYSAVFSQGVWKVDLPHKNIEKRRILIITKQVFWSLYHPNEHLGKEQYHID
ncbi:14764_t:CDS:2, partial [Gigaspora margarita]